MEVAMENLAFAGTIVLVAILIGVFLVGIYSLCLSSKKREEAYNKHA
jgi:hypothetical protein